MRPSRSRSPPPLRLSLAVVGLSERGPVLSFLTPSTLPHSRILNDSSSGSAALSSSPRKSSTGLQRPAIRAVPLSRSLYTVRYLRPPYPACSSALSTALVLCSSLSWTNLYISFPVFGSGESSSSPGASPVRMNYPLCLHVRLSAFLAPWMTFSHI
ncbi:hypothetical protein BD413DRAFT_164481 [Trametes elegans]|nr:hypothetical protein BD413DRAFT_164481 [Trametes elegans]